MGRHLWVWRPRGQRLAIVRPSGTLSTRYESGTVRWFRKAAGAVTWEQFATAGLGVRHRKPECEPEEAQPDEW